VTFSIGQGTLRGDLKILASLTPRASHTTLPYGSCSVCEVPAQVNLWTQPTDIKGYKMDTSNISNGGTQDPPPEAPKPDLKGWIQYDPDGWRAAGRAGG
jgi:hypothetical protein